MAGYEDLRRRVIAGGGSGSRLGLALLLREGIAAWIAGWSRCPGIVPSVEAERGSPEEVLPDESCADVVRLLAHMVLIGLEEKRA
jgi:hypothetical protein